MPCNMCKDGISRRWLKYHIGDPRCRFCSRNDVYITLDILDFNKALTAARLDEVGQMLDEDIDLQMGLEAHPIPHLVVEDL